MLFLVADVLTRRGDWLTKEYDQHTHIIVAGYITSNSRVLHYTTQCTGLLQCTKDALAVQLLNDYWKK